MRNCWKNGEIPKKILYTHQKLYSQKQKKESLSAIHGQLKRLLFAEPPKKIVGICNEMRIDLASGDAYIFK